MTVPATISRRRWLIGAGLITVSALVTADGCAAQRVGRFGFTVSSPQPGLEEFERDVRAVHELGAEWVRFGVVGFEVIRSWSEKGSWSSTQSVCASTTVLLHSWNHWA